MARSLNKVMLIGNLGADPELRNAGDAKACNLSIATDEGYTDRNGAKVDKVEWHTAVCWEKLAEIATQYLKKGDKVYIEGNLETRKYEKDGVTHYRTQIRVRNMLMLGSPNGGNGGGGNGGAPRTQQRPAAAPARNTGFEDFQAPAGMGEDDDLPF